GDGDEPHLDRDLEVLQAAKLAEQVGDLFVDLGRVPDDQADAEEERDDRPGGPRLLVEPSTAATAAEAAAQAVRGGDVIPGAVGHLPGPRGDRRRDELDQRGHVDLGPIALVRAQPAQGGRRRVLRGRVIDRGRLHTAWALVDRGWAGRVLHRRRQGRVG